jgi:hypothetical protein
LVYGRFIYLSFTDGVIQRFVRDPSVSEFSTTLNGPAIDCDLSKFVPAEVKAGTHSV